MEAERQLMGENQHGYKDAVIAFGRKRASATYSVLTDAVLTELKRQAPEGCVLCSLDSLDEEEWD